MRRLPDHHFLDKAMKGWIVKTAKKHYWRVAAWLELEDIIQEGFLAYAICNHRYRRRVANRQHFMALVQVVFIQRITDMANARTRGQDIPISQLVDRSIGAAPAMEHLAGVAEGDAELRATLNSAPLEIKLLLLLLSDDVYLRKMTGHLRQRPGGLRETNSERLCRWMGIPYTDLEAMLADTLGVRR